MSPETADAVRFPRTSAISVFLYFVAAMGSRPIIPLLALENGFSGFEIGVLTAAFAILPLFGATAIGAWIDLHGIKRVLIGGAVATALGLMVPMLLPGRPALYLSQIVVGMGLTLFTVASQKHAGSLGGSADDRQRSIAVFSVMVSLGSLVGPILLGLVAQRAGFAPALFASSLSLVICVGLLLKLKDTEHASADGKGRLLNNPFDALGYHRFMLRAFMISTVVLLARDTYMAYFPVYAQDKGISTAWIGIITGLQNGGSVLARGLLMQFVRWLGRSGAVVLSVLLTGLSFIAIPFCESIPALLAVSVLLGIGLGVGQPLSIGTVIGLAPLHKVGEVLGTRLTFNRLSQIVAPLAFGGIAAQAGLAGSFWFFGALMALSCRKLSIPDDAAYGDGPPTRHS